MENCCWRFNLHLPTDAEPENYEHTSFELFFIRACSVKTQGSYHCNHSAVRTNGRTLVIEQGNCVETSTLHVADSRDTAVAFATLPRQSSE
jgi:hypothetical protein